MDDIVARAMAKWPNVPAVYGWLALDRRGEWSIKSESDAGFEHVTNPKLIEFIGRNYGHDDEGRWYFQNGPQRVYVTLAYTPLVYRIARAHPLAFETHSGVPCVELRSVWMDEAGNLLFVTEHGPGLLLDRDLTRGLEALSYADGHALEEEQPGRPDRRGRRGCRRVFQHRRREPAAGADQGGRGAAAPGLCARAAAG